MKMNLRAAALTGALMAASVSLLAGSAQAGSWGWQHGGWGWGGGGYYGYGVGYGYDYGYSCCGCGCGAAYYAPAYVLPYYDYPSVAYAPAHRPHYYYYHRRHITSPYDK
jgi:hypothetical protein